jgi:glycosyltransferase involved in cell wall biosynthesis
MLNLERLFRRLVQFQIQEKSVSSKTGLLFVITKTDLGGAQKNVLDLIHSFYLEYNVHLACGELGPLTEDIKELGIPVHVLPRLKRSIQGIDDLICVQQFVALIRKVNPSIIHAHSSKAGVVARLAGWICHVPTVFTAHGWGFSPGTPKLRGTIALIIEKLLAPISTRIICVAESDRQLALRQGVGNPKVLTTIRYGIPSSSVCVAEPSTHPVRLIMVARFNEQKDQVTLLMALSKLSHSSIHLDLVGSGVSLEPCEALAQSLGIETQVSFLGDRRDVPQLLSRSQIFVLSTHYEGLPISILEAMRTGLPVIASEVNGIPEEVIHGKTGLLVPPRDATALANAIDTLIQSPALRQQMGQAGRERFEQEFSLDQMISKTRAVYNEILCIQTPKRNPSLSPL